MLAGAKPAEDNVLGELGIRIQLSEAMFFEQFEGKLIVTLSQRAVTHHVGEHDGRQFTLFAGVAHLLGSWQSF